MKVWIALEGADWEGTRQRIVNRLTSEDRQVYLTKLRMSGQTGIVIDGVEIFKFDLEDDLQSTRLSAWESYSLEEGW